MPERFDKAARAGDSAKGLVHYRNRLQKARCRRGLNARKIAKFERKVQKYNNALAAAAPEYAALEAKVLKKLCSLRKKTVKLQRGASRRSACGRSCCWRGCACAKESTALSKFDML